MDRLNVSCSKRTRCWISEVSMALVLLIGAALLIGTYIALRDVNPGLDAHNLLTLVADAVTTLVSHNNANSVWAVRTRETHIRTSAITKQLRIASGGFPVGNVRTMSEIVAQSTARRDFNMLLLTIFGVAPNHQDTSPAAVSLETAGYRSVVQRCWN
jgi:hypothetical protein